MSIQATAENERVMLAAIPGSSRQEQAEVGEQVAEVLEHPGFHALVHALHTHKEGLLQQRLYRQPTADAAAYADVTGHIRGLDEVGPIARGLVENGKHAAQALRIEEDEG